MKILIVSAMFPPTITGTAFYTKNLAATLTSMGHQVSVVTIDRKGTKKETFPFKVVRLKSLQFPLKNYFKHFSLTSIFPGNYSTISRICKQDGKPDAIVLVNQYLDISFPAIYASVVNRIPLYVSIGTQIQSLNPFRNKILNILDRLIIGNLIYPFARRIICWDKEIERYVNDIQRRKFADKTTIIPFGVDSGLKNFLKGHSYKIHNQILGVGAVIGHRNFIFNIRVFKELLKTYPELNLKIIGYVYDKETVNLVNKLKLGSKILFTGELPHEQVLKELQVSDIHWMMLDGEYKGLGTSNLEAMLMGVPIVSNVPENLLGEGLLKDMENCILVDDRSIEEAVGKITAVLEDENIRKGVGTQGKEFVRKNMSWEKIGKMHDNLFKENSH
jgi:glycosyltransferase involved in cell wall biosynthesis